MNILTSTHTVTHVVADIPMSMKNMNMLTHTATHAVADIPMRAQVITTSMKNMNMLTHTAMHVVAVMTMKNMVIPMRMATHAVADMIMRDIPMIMHMLIPMHTTFRDTPLTASAKSAIRMKNTATFAAKA